MNTNLIVIRNIFVGKSARLIRVLLTKPSEMWTTRKLASEADVSLGLVSMVTNKLIDMGFLVRDRSMLLKLRREEELLRRWASIYNFYELSHRAYYAQGTLYEIAARLVTAAEKSNFKYAFTGPFATDLLTQYIRPAEIHIYVANENVLRKIVEDISLEIAEIGGNMIFLTAKDNSVFYGIRKITDIRVGEVFIVSDVQLILDLFNYTDRTREAAEKLITKKFARISEHRDIVKLAREYFEQKGLVFEEPKITASTLRPDVVLFDPETNEHVIVECKNSLAKLDSVDQLKKLVSFFGNKAKGVLIAPSITNVAMEELKKAGLEFKPVEVMQHGLHKGAS
jgi:hypothetical protein